MATVIGVRGPYGAYQSSEGRPSELAQLHLIGGCDVEVERIVAAAKDVLCMADLDEDYPESAVLAELIARDVIRRKGPYLSLEDKWSAEERLITEWRVAKHLDVRHDR